MQQTNTHSQLVVSAHPCLWLQMRKLVTQPTVKHNIATLLGRVPIGGGDRGKVALLADLLEKVGGLVVSMCFVSFFLACLCRRVCVVVTALVPFVRCSWLPRR